MEWRFNYIVMLLQNQKITHGGGIVFIILLVYNSIIIAQKQMLFIESRFC